MKINYNFRSYFLILQYLIVFISAQLIQELYEGNECTLENGHTGICKKLPECRAKLEEFRQGRYERKTCRFQGSIEIVCCPYPIGDKFGIRPAELVCHQYENEVSFSLEVLNFHVLSGIKAEEGEFPFMAALGYIDRDDENKTNIKYSCGGTLISPQFVLTAAHCVRNINQDVPVQVRLGSISLGSKNENVQEVRIQEIIPHPQYKTSAVYNDIALLKLTKKVKWSSTVKPICLQTKQLKGLDPPANGSFVVTGWGATNIDEESSIELMKTPGLRLVSTADCRASYGTSRQLSRGLDDTVLCAKDQNETRRSDACQGDSGGPLLRLSNDDGDTVIGVTSFGQSCGGPIPGVYTSVYSFLDWIETVVWPEIGK